MKIFQVNNYLEHKGGAEESMLELADALEARGHQLGFVYHCKSTKTLSFPHRPTYCVPALEAKIWPNLWRLVQLAVIMKRERPDVVIVHNVYNLWTVALLRRLAPTIRLVHGHEMYCMGLYKNINELGGVCTFAHSYTCLTNCRQDLWFPLRVILYLYRKAEIRVNRRLERLLVTSRYMKQNLLANGFQEGKIEVLPPFIAPEAVGLPPPSSLIVLFVGRLEDIKGTRLLPEIAKLLPVGAKLVVVGDGELKEELLESSFKAGLEDRLILHGWLSKQDLLRVYSDGRVVIFPSLVEEPFGRVGIEAMAAGRPVVAFDVGGVKDWLIHGENGFLVPRGDVEKMAEFTTLLLEHPELANKMGRMGRKRVSSLFDRDMILSRLEQILNEAIDSWRAHRRPAP
jgi:glycosyltransferase involved in cell wall biosynthesis